MDFDLFGVFLMFQGSLLVIVIMIDSSEKRNCEGFRVRVFLKRVVKHKQSNMVIAYLTATVQVSSCSVQRL